MKKNVKSFDQFLNEMESTEMEASFESPEATGATVSVEDYQDKKGGSPSGVDNASAYIAALKSVANKYVGKKLGTLGNWGAVTNPHWVIESFADVSFSSMKDQGAGLMLRAKRAEGKGQGGDWNPTVFVSIDVTKDPKRAEFDQSMAYGSSQKRPRLVPDSNGYYGVVQVMKRIGMNDMDIDSKQGFTTAELINRDPDWKPIVDDVIAVANKYGMKG